MHLQFDSDGSRETLTHPRTPSCTAILAPLDQRIGDVYATNRIRAWLLTVFAATSLALTCLGIYGTLSYAVSLRRREVSLRVALGAVSGRIVAQFLSRALRVVGAACVAGIVLAIAFAQVLSGMLYRVSPMDPLTFGVVIAAVLSVAAVAACARVACVADRSE